MLVLHERENAKDMERLIRTITEQCNAEKRRADNAERDLVEVLTRLRTVNDEKLAATRDAEKAKRELSLYQIQLEKAAFEIKRAQETVNAVDAQRVRAEEEAARARSTARRLNEERLIEIAREEGRRIGILEGLQRGREFTYGRRYISSVPVTTTEEELFDDDESVVSRRDYARAARGPFNERRQSTDGGSDEAVPTPPRPQDPVPEPPEPEPQMAHAPPPRPPSTTPSALTGIMSPRHPPPDNFIPTLNPGEEGIRIPPPHEFVQQTPQAVVEPPLPPMTEAQQTPGPHRRRRSHHHYGYRQSSPESLSTTLSHMDMVKEPAMDREIMTPMSAIEEVRSAGPSPNPTPGPMDIGPSRATPVYTPARSNAPPIYRRPSSSSSDSSRLVPRRPPLSRSVTSGTTVPDISVQPPSRSDSAPDEDDAQAAEDLLTPADAEDPLAVPAPEALDTTIDELPPGFVPAGFTPAAKASPLPGSNPMPTPRSMPPATPRGMPAPSPRGMPTPSAGMPTPVSMPQPGQPRIYADGPVYTDGPAYGDAQGYGDPQGYGGSPSYGDGSGYVEGPAVIPPPLDDEAVDSGMESDDGTLTTPPPKSHPLQAASAAGSRRGTPSAAGSRRGTPSVASTVRRAAGMPLPGSAMTAAGVPLPATGMTAAGVPLPPSGMTAAGVPLPPTPASTVRSARSKSRFSNRG